jgi:hypothetical protein
MRQVRWSASTFGHAVVIFAVLSPLLTYLLIQLEWAVGGWVGGGHLPFHAWVVALPSVLSAVGGIAAIVAGIAKPTPWAVVEGLVALLVGAAQFLAVGFILGLGSIS